MRLVIIIVSLPEKRPKPEIRLIPRSLKTKPKLVAIKLETSQHL
jgi:hypothetical protein